MYNLLISINSVKQIYCKKLFENLNFKKLLSNCDVKLL